MRIIHDSWHVEVCLKRASSFSRFMEWLAEAERCQLRRVGDGALHYESMPPQPFWFVLTPISLSLFRSCFDPVSILSRSCFDPVSILQCALLSYGIDCTVPELEEVYVQHPIHAAVLASHVPSLGDCNVSKAPLSLASSRRTVMVTPPSDSDASLRANGSASRGIFDW
jgi:hypothetical protein